MMLVEQTCPRCFKPLAQGARFCRRCGLVESVDRLGERLALGAISIVYRRGNGVLKIARDACTNHFIRNEAEVLEQLADPRFGPFLPKLATSTVIDGRSANLLAMDEQIASANELYTLEEARARHPDGIDARNVAWIWRRLLSVLGFIHTRDIVHAAVLPENILIEPREHKLVVIDFCCAVSPWRSHSGPAALIGGYRRWYGRSGFLRKSPTPALDIALAARCMIELLGGDAIEETFPAHVPQALARHFQRCIGDPTRAPDAWRLLDDFDRLIEALWGPRRYVTFAMPLRH